MHTMTGLGRMGILVVILAAAVVLAAVGGDLRLGGSTEVTGTAYPAASGSAALEGFVGLGNLEASARTEFSLFPYTMGAETLAVHLVREWLSVGAEYQFSVLPLGITSATIVSSALPPPWESSMGDTALEFTIDAEARLVGYTFATAPLRAEVWMKAAISASRSLGWLDEVLLGASLEATLSSPGDGRIWPVSTAVAELSLGCASLRSETTLALAPSIRLDTERISLRAAWSDLGVSAEAALTLASEPVPVAVELRFSYEFGDPPLRRAASDTGCMGGVCR